MEKMNLSILDVKVSLEKSGSVGKTSNTQDTTAILGRAILGKMILGTN